MSLRHCERSEAIQINNFIAISKFAIKIVIKTIQEVILMAKKGKDYFGQPWLISLILAIIPVTSWLLGAVTRFQEGKPIAGIIRLLLLGWNVLWIIDILCILLQGKILRILNC